MSEPESKDVDDARDADEPSFRVIDRRRFAADGSEREEGGATAKSGGGSSPEKPAPAVSGAEPPPASPTAERSPAAASGRSPEASAGTGEGFVLGSDSTASAATSHDVPEPTLSTLLLSLSTQALMHLGEIPDLATGKPERDLPAARSIIDLLGVLERKTQGNLDAAETALLERILYDLRMRFVELSRS
jgi:uncharacterized protein DUF1844